MFMSMESMSECPYLPGGTFNAVNINTCLLLLLGIYMFYARTVFCDVVLPLAVSCARKNGLLGWKVCFSLSIIHSPGSLLDLIDWL